MAHLDTLVSDTHDRLRAEGIDCGYVQAGRPSSPDAPAQVCSIQTLHARGLSPDAYLVIVDECHRANAATIKAILAKYQGAKILGLTATPARGDGQALGDVFEHMERGPSVQQLTDDGFLVPCSVLAPGVEFDSKHIAEDPLVAYTKATPGKRAIVFARSVDEARELTGRFDAAGFSAECITGETKRAEREGLRDRITAGTTKVLVGVDVFREGFDCPAIETVLLASKINHIGEWLQCIGRGLRLSKETGKTSCTVLDLFGCVHKHGVPATPIEWSLDGERNGKTMKNSTRICPDCRAIFAIHLNQCPRCGSDLKAFTRPALVPEVMGVELAPAKGPAPVCHDDEQYVNSIAKKLGRGRPPGVGLKIAIGIFAKRFNRMPNLGTKQQRRSA